MYFLDMPSFKMFLLSMPFFESTGSDAECDKIYSCKVNCIWMIIVSLSLVVNICVKIFSFPKRKQNTATHLYSIILFNADSEIGSNGKIVNKFNKKYHLCFFVVICYALARSSNITHRLTWDKIERQQNNEDCL